MNFDITKEKAFGAILQDIELANGLLKDASVKYKNEDWYPVIIKDQISGMRGFEINYSGKWGGNKEVGRKKLGLKELIINLAEGKFSPSAAIRCKRLRDSQRNGRDVCDLKLSPRLNELIVRLRNNTTTVFPKTINNDESMGISSKEVTGGNELNIIGNTISGQSGDLSLPILDTEQSELSISSNAQDDLSTDTENLTTDEREAVVKVRFGQGSFRDVLIGILGAKCWMSGVEGKQLLVASHIKPWSHCKEDADSRGNSNNGLLLSSLWDSAFDAGLISFDEDWQVICSTVLSQSAKQALNLDQYKVLPEKIRNVGRAKFLAYHRAEVFEGWKKETSPKEGNK